MAQRVDRYPAQAARRIVAEALGDVPVCCLVQRDRGQDRNDPDRRGPEDGFHQLARRMSAIKVSKRACSLAVSASRRLELRKPFARAIRFRAGSVKGGAAAATPSISAMS